jgi:hypothetical protein
MNYGIFWNQEETEIEYEMEMNLLVVGGTEV